MCMLHDKKSCTNPLFIVQMAGWGSGVGVEEKKPPPGSVDTVGLESTFGELRVASGILLYHGKQRAIQAEKAGPLKDAGFFVFMRELAIALHYARNHDMYEKVADLMKFAYTVLKDVETRKVDTQQYKTAIEGIENYGGLEVALWYMNVEEAKIRAQLNIAPGQRVVPFTHFLLVDANGDALPSEGNVAYEVKSVAPPAVAAIADEVVGLGASLEQFHAASYIMAFEWKTRAEHAEAAGPLADTGFFAFMPEVAIALANDAKGGGTRRSTLQSNAGSILSTVDSLRIDVSAYRKLLTFTTKDNQRPLADVLLAMQAEEARIRSDLKIAPGQRVVPLTHFLLTDTNGNALESVGVAYELCASDALPLLDATVYEVQDASYLTRPKELRPRPQVAGGTGGPLSDAGIFSFVREVLLMTRKAQREGDSALIPDLLRAIRTVSEPLDPIGKQSTNHKSKGYMKSAELLVTGDYSLDEALHSMEGRFMQTCADRGIDPNDRVPPYTCFLKPKKGGWDDGSMVEAPQLVNRLLERGHTQADEKALMRGALPEIDRTAMKLVRSYEKGILEKGQNLVPKQHSVPVPTLDASIAEMQAAFKEDIRYRIAFNIYVSMGFEEAKAGWEKSPPTPDGAFVYYFMQALLDRMPPIQTPLVVYRGNRSRTMYEYHTYFVSTSLSYDAAYKFCNLGGTVTEIFIPTGCKVVPAFAFTSMEEEEVILHHDAWTVRPGDRAWNPAASDWRHRIERAIYVPHDWRRRQADQMAQSCERVEKAAIEWARYDGRMAFGQFAKRYKSAADDPMDFLVDTKRRRREETFESLLEEAYANGGFLPA